MPWKATAPRDVTLLTAPGRRLTKLITEAGIVGYDRASTFAVDAVRIKCVEDMSELLGRLAGDPHVCIVRGALRLELTRRRVQV